MLRKTHQPIIIVSALLLFFQFLSAEQVSKWEWQKVERVVAIGDVHGEYDKLVKLLTGLELTDAELKWTGGKTHLVLCGDLLDRGKKERAVMDLLMRLQNEAKKQGGEVHTLLGNHDVMNLVLDFRYVDPANYADFIKEEKSRDRKKGYDGFKRIYEGEKLKESQLKAAFDEKYPSGYFGRLKAFELKGQYGAWLIEHPTMIKINDVVYVHAGLTEGTAELGIDKVNQQVQKSIKDYLKYAQTLVPYIKGPAQYAELYALADSIVNQSSSGPIPRNLVDASRGLIDETEKYMVAENGPFWYRGNSLENEMDEWLRLRTSRQHLKADIIVIAHTPTKTGDITSRFSGSLFRTDVGMVYGRPPLALDLSGQGNRVFNPYTVQFEAPVLEDQRGEGISKVPEQLPEPQMRAFLSEATIINSIQEERDNRKYRVVELEKDHSHRRAFFLSVAEKPPSDQTDRTKGYRHYKHEYAAYLLDRELGLGFVPITVLREVDGELGTLQEWAEKAVNLTTLLRGGGFFKLEDILKEMKDQISQVRLFWALLDVRDNHPGLKLYLPDEKRIMVGDNTIAFSLSSRLQEDLLFPLDRPELNIGLHQGQFMLNPGFDLALRTLNFAGLKELLGQYIEDDEIRALLARRDKLLERCSPEYQDK